MHHRFPSFYQWKELLFRLSKKDRFLLSCLLIAGAVSFAYLLNTFYIEHTKQVPTYGGSLTEGIVGFPRFLNPLYAATQDADRDLSEIIYSGLLSYDEKGTLSPTLLQPMSSRKTEKALR